VKKERLKELEKEFQDSNFWQDKERAVKISKEFDQLKEQVEGLEELQEELELIGGEEDVRYLEKKIRKKETEMFFSGKYDKGGAILSIYSGAGGREAEDWATMLLRMYERYCQKEGFNTHILHQSFGESGGPEGRTGTKSVTIEIKGPFAYGLLKKEDGVHRLVRVSPFSAQNLRHTSFALVEVLPKIGEASKEVEMEPEDLKIDFYRASGPGGQYVNKRETAVRITHLPTGLVASCQSERSQALNRKKAEEVLSAKLYHLQQKIRDKEISEIKGKRISASWGNQIRSYVLHPYKMVKDLRTETETSRVEDILDGELDEFIEAEIKLENPNKQKS
jgi:peptide chain release factor 2